MEHKTLNQQVQRMQDIVEILHKSWKLNPYKTEDIDMKVRNSQDMTKERKKDN